MEGVTFMRASNLHNVAGRIDYIQSEEKQENLYATYETAPIEFWQELAQVNREEFKKYGTNGQCIEARELVIALPKQYSRFTNKDEILETFTERFKDKYGVECISAMHHNKRKTNLHIHLIFSEREKMPEPIEKIATRTMYFDNHGKKVRTKKEAMNEKGKLKRGYKMVPKGEVYERTAFYPKKKEFKDKAFLDEVKEFYTELINYGLNEHEKMIVFPRNSPYLPTKKIGKNNPKAREIATNNWLRDEWNKSMNMLRVRHKIPLDRAKELKRALVIVPTKELKEKAEKKEPILFRDLLANAVRTLRAMLSELRRIPLSEREDLWKEQFRKFVDYCKEKAPYFRLTREDREDRSR